MAKPSDFVVDNASGSAVRTDLNNIFDAISINNGFGSVPTVKYKYMWYADEATGKMSFYKANATDKLDFISLSTGAFFGPDGSTANPSYTFSNSTSTGFYRPNANQIGASCNGVASTIFKETGVDVAGDLVVQHPTGGDSKIEVIAPAAGDDAFIDLVGDTTHADYGLRIRRIGGSSSTATDGPNSNSEILHKGSGALHLNSQDSNSTILFSTVNTARFRISAAGSLRADHSSVTTGANNTETGTFQGRGFGCRTGLTTDNGNIINGAEAASVNTGHHFNIWWSDTHAYFYIDSVRLGYLMLGTSDYRKKRNIENLDINGIERLKKLRPVKYQDKAFQIFKQTEDIHEGFIAHEMQEVIPDAVKQEKDKEIQTIDYLPVLSTLTKALQEAVAKIEVLEAKVAALEAS